MKRLLLQSAKKIYWRQPAASLSLMRMLERPTVLEDTGPNFPRKIFSGIQPSGSLHLGNYLGAIQKWIRLQNAQESVTFCIVDMHSITLPQCPVALRENIFEMAATILACDINPDYSTLFVQSTVPEHMELCWILSCLCTMPRLGHLPQYKEKAKMVKDVPLGLYVYPILQAADILLYKATHVPVGEDQLQHIQLTQHLAKNFNNRYGPTFPICQAMIENQDAARVRSLRNPSKKMSKSDLDSRATINIRDEPDVIVDKIKKAVTDFTSDVSYDPNSRPGVSNLVAIHSLVTGVSIDQVLEDAKCLDTGRYKMRVAEAVVEHLKPMRMKIDFHLSRRQELINVLQKGADKAREQARETLAEIREKIGLGISPVIPQSLTKLTEVAEPPTIDKDKVKEEVVIEEKSDMPVVPKQRVRLEKKRSAASEYRLAPEFETSVSLLPPVKKSSTVSTGVSTTAPSKAAHKLQLRIIPPEETKSVIATESEVAVKSNN
ncbi:tryptophan--tRNA ligase, mitochondrial [Glossina fuscipes]|uniref:Tryptophan--tRNA ligase, mitochondrial n=2 Tax=Nemorhina TaxID=44051 RepID=A0A8U0W8T9_9MUSC|nr:tryptophan--tRNA ligase, mitochondrial [Glossina fuscipes]KAI9587014.1 hypothetical protein GQX74_002861 [Glossina fuscipes]